MADLGRRAGAPGATSLLTGGLPEHDGRDAVLTVGGLASSGGPEESEGDEGQRSRDHDEACSVPD
jgi:hypothetical protein